MKKGNWIAWLVVVLMAVLAVGGLVRLFEARFAAGDVYPPYTSLRSDPLGVRAYYDSLVEWGGLPVSRNFKPLPRAMPASDAALLVLGDPMGAYPNSDVTPRDTAAELTCFVRGGGRLVLTLRPHLLNRLAADELSSEPGSPCGKKCGSGRDGEPADSCARRDQSPTSGAGGATNTVAGSPGGDSGASGSKPKARHRRADAAVAAERTVLLTTNWLGLGFAPLGGKAPQSARLQDGLGEVGAGLPSILSCGATLGFTNLVAGWTVLYRCAGLPVLIERQLGAGSMVVASWSYFVSNEALFKEREPGLLLWLLGGRKRVVFDETHHGLVENGGLAELAHQYGMGWPLASLLVLALLFVWRNSSSLVPAPPDGVAPLRGAAVSGRDALAGLVNLLRRNVPSNAIRALCEAERMNTKK